jgi:hypothetical protein
MADRLMALSTSAVATCHSTDSLSSRVSRATSVSRAGAAPRLDGALGALPPLGFNALLGRAVAGRLPALEN